MRDRHEGNVLVILGASTGFSEAAVRLLWQEGAILVLDARRADRIQLLTDERMVAGGQAHALVTAVQIAVASPFETSVLIRTDAMFP